MEKEENMSKRGQIYLLMGYLGSGKTSFIRNLLQNKQGEKYAVIQNEFSEGEMGIQQPLIVDESGIPFSSFLELPNGCICCSAKNDLIASIEYILNNTDVKRIVVETNGLADPAQSIKQFWFDEEMKINAYLHSVISIFSVNKFPSIKGQELLEKQIVFANKALITFVDKSTQNQLQKLQDYIRERNQQCQIKRNDIFDILDFLSNGSLFDLSSLNYIDEKQQLEQFPQKQTLSCLKCCEIQQNHELISDYSHCGNKDNKKQNRVHQQKKNYHQGINSIFIRGKCLLKQKIDIETRVGSLLWESGIKILRIKGVYCLQSIQTVYELQGVDDVFEVKQTKTTPDKYNHQTKILVIVQDQFQKSSQPQGVQDLQKEQKSSISNKLAQLLGVISNQ